MVDKLNENYEEEDSELVEYNEESSDLVEDTEDGGALVTLEDEEEIQEELPFYDNIVELFEESMLNSLSSNLMQDIGYDKEARTLRDKQYAEAIRRTGLGDEAPGGAQFNGASRVVHPLLTEACVDFASRTIRELMPSKGPVDTYIPEENPTKQRYEKAERVKTAMNWQFLTQMPEFRDELEQVLTQLALSGTQYLRLIYDNRRKRPVPKAWPIDDTYLPYSASNFYTADRKTFVEHITGLEFQSRVEMGMYRDVNVILSASTPDLSEPARASERIEGKEENSGFNPDGLRDIYEVVGWFDLDEEGVGLAPYRITLEETSQKIVAVNRNWEKNDETKQPMDWIIEFGFVPWRGAYHIGLGHLIGSLSGAATGALRALLDSAHVNNFPSLIKLKGVNFTGQTKNLELTSVTEIEGGVGIDDIRKLAMPIPFNPPSPVLFQLLGFLVDAGRGVVKTSFDNLAEGHPNMPVGTTLSLIEEGLKVLSGIHSRLYQSMNRIFGVLARINRMYLTAEELKNSVGTVLARRDDFNEPHDVVPVADPNIFSDTQRLAQLQVIAARADTHPDLYNRRAIEERILERTKIPNPEELLLPELKPQEQNAVNENGAMSLGRPVTAFPEQDHLSHLQVHIQFMRTPFLGALPIIAPAFLPAAVNHLREHLVLWYIQSSHDLLKEALGYDDDQLSDLLKSKEDKPELDKTLAIVSNKVIESGGSIFQSLPQIINEAQQVLQQFVAQPQIPVDPNKQAELQQKAEMEQMKQQSHQQDLQFEQQKIQVEMQREQQRAQEEKELKFLELSAEERQRAVDAANSEAVKAREYAARLRELQLKEQAADNRTAVELASRERINTQDNQTALRIAAAEVASGERVSFETGTGINPSE